METQENFNSEIILNDNSKKYLIESAKWGKFLAIMGFISIGILFLIGLLSSFLMGSLLNQMDTEFTNFKFIGIVYVVISIVYLFPTLYLYRFSVKMKKAILLNDESQFEYALLNQKSLFKFVGIFTIIMIALYLLMIVGSIVFSSMLIN